MKAAPDKFTSGSPHRTGNPVSAALVPSFSLHAATNHSATSIKLGGLTNAAPSSLLGTITARFIGYSLGAAASRTTPFANAGLAVRSGVKSLPVERLFARMPPRVGSRVERAVAVPGGRRLGLLGLLVLQQKFDARGG